MIRGSRDDEEALKGLMGQFNLRKSGKRNSGNELRRLTGLEREKIESEYDH